MRKIIENHMGLNKDTDERMKELAKVLLLYEALDVLEACCSEYMEDKSDNDEMDEDVAEVMEFLGQHSNEIKRFRKVCL